MIQPVRSFVFHPDVSVYIPDLSEFRNSDRPENVPADLVEPSEERLFLREKKIPATYRPLVSRTGLRSLHVVLAGATCFAALFVNKT